MSGELRTARIDRAAADDAAAILELLRGLAREHEDYHVSFTMADDWAGSMEGYIAERLRGIDHYLAVARADAGVVGVVVASLRRVPAFARSPRGYLENLVVAPAMRRHGIGRRLVEAAAMWCEARGAVGVELSVAVTNAAGREFWQTCGFEPVLLHLARECER